MVSGPNYPVKLPIPTELPMPTKLNTAGTVVERWSLTGELSCPALDLQLTGDHLLWVTVNRPL